MTPAADAPLQIETAGLSPSREARLVVELTGRWRGAASGLGEPVALRLELGGVVHRLAESAMGTGDAAPPSDGERRAAVEAELAAAIVRRDTASAQVAALRDELARLSTEVAGASEASDASRSSGGAELDEARALLAETRALAATLLDRSAAPGADDDRR